MRHNTNACLAIVIALACCSVASAEHLETFTQPYSRVAVPASEIGTISEILVKEGDEVLRSQVLARLNDEVLQASLQVARAAKDALGARRTAETELLTREKQLESYRELFAEGNATQRELDRSESDYQQSVSRLQTVREELEVRRLEYERVKAQLRQRVIESTIDGHVISIEKEVGEFVSPTDPIVMHIAHLKTLKAVFSVPTDAARNLETGQEVTVSIGYQQQRARAFIDFVSPVAEAESNTVIVKLRIPNPKQQLQSGVICHWELKMSRKRMDPTRQATRDQGENTAL